MWHPLESSNHSNNSVSQRYVYPGIILFVDELGDMQGSCLLLCSEPFVDLSVFCLAAVDVGGATREVQRAFGTTYGGVESRAAVAAGDDDGKGHSVTQGLQDLVGEGEQVLHGGERGGGVVYAALGGGGGAYELGECKVFYHGVMCGFF